MFGAAEQAGVLFADDAGAAKKGNFGSSLAAEMGSLEQ